MWYIFPQFAGLGFSSTAKLYAIKSVDKARAYLAHPILGPRLVECAKAVVDLEGRTATQIFGFPDDMKLRSCATLFACVSSPASVFHRLIEKYYGGELDAATLRLLGVDADVGRTTGDDLTFRRKQSRRCWDRAARGAVCVMILAATLSICSGCDDRARSTGPGGTTAATFPPADAAVKPIPRLADGFESGSIADFWLPGTYGTGLYLRRCYRGQRALRPKWQAIRADHRQGRRHRATRRRRAERGESRTRLGALSVPREGCLVWVFLSAADGLPDRSRSPRHHFLETE